MEVIRKLIALGVGTALVAGAVIYSETKQATATVPEMVTRTLKLLPRPPQQEMVPQLNTRLLWAIVGSASVYYSLKLYFKLLTDVENYKIQLIALRQENNRNLADLAANTTTNQQSNACVVCWDNPRCVVTYPCKHLGMCSTCAQSMRASSQSRCPVCQQNISNFEVVFTP